MEDKLRRTASRISGALGLPRDIITNAPRVVLEGETYLSVENHRGIVSFTPDKLRLLTGIGVLSVGGQELLIEYLGPEDIIIVGKLSYVSFEDDRV